MSGKTFLVIFLHWKNVEDLIELCAFDLKSDINVDWNGIERAKPTCFWNSDRCGLEWKFQKIL